MEEQLQDVVLLHVAQDEIRKAYPLILPGDIIALTTDITGLDVAHTGLAYVDEGGNVGLLHASSKGSVLVSEDLAAYVRGNKRQVGIVVVRALDV